MYPEFRIDDRQPLRRVLRNGLLVRVRGNPPYVLRARAAVDRRSARETGLARKAVTVAKVQRSLPAGPRDLRLKLGSDAKRALRGADSVKLKVSATARAAAGGTRVLAPRTAKISR